MEVRLVKVESGTSKGKYSIQKRNQNSTWTDLIHFNDYKEARKHYLEFSNPIKDNRVVSDSTFATRFHRFLNEIQPNDAASEEELKYLKGVSRDLLRYQNETVEPNSDEWRYLNNIRIQ